MAYTSILFAHTYNSIHKHTYKYAHAHTDIYTLYHKHTHIAHTHAHTSHIHITHHTSHITHTHIHTHTHTQQTYKSLLRCVWLMTMSSASACVRVRTLIHRYHTFEVFVFLLKGLNLGDLVCSYIIHHTSYIIHHHTSYIVHHTSYIIHTYTDTISD